MTKFCVHNSEYIKYDNHYRNERSNFKVEHYLVSADMIRFHSYFTDVDPYYSIGVILGEHDNGDLTILGINEPDMGFYCTLENSGLELTPLNNMHDFCNLNYPDSKYLKIGPRLPAVEMMSKLNNAFETIINDVLAGCNKLF